METFVLLEEKAQVKDEWRSATMVLLGLCVMTTGMNMMLKLSADSWDTVLKVSWKPLQQSQLSQVVCLLGSVPVKRAGFGNGSGMIVLDDLDCSGSEGPPLIYLVKTCFKLMLQLMYLLEEIC